MKTLVVLGAADGSLATYRQAREQGYRTLAVDRRDTAPAVELADEFLPVSTRDTEVIFAALEDRDDVAGVIAPASDIALPTQLALADRLGLPCGLSDAMVRASVDKRFLRHVCDQIGLPRYWWTDEPTEAGTVWPVVVKPADAQSSRGVARCGTRDELLAALPAARAASYTDSVIVEAEVRGTQVTAEAVVVGGRIGFLGLTARTLTDPPLAITTSHFAPAELETKPVVDQLDQVCAALGYRRGPLTADLVVGPDGTPWLIELGARTGGDPLGRLMRRAYGVDTVAASIAAATGTPIVLDVGPTAAALARIHAAPRSGVLAGLPSIDRSWLDEFVMFAEPGEAVQSTTTLAGKLGYSFFSGGTRAELVAAADELDDALGALIQEEV